jgi:CRISPR-associated protein Cas5h
MEHIIDRIIVIDLKGAMAHFREFYTNSSSLTYSFPPRTVVTGILAGVMGLPRDSYYDKFNSQSCRLGMSILSPFRKIMNTLNYSYMKSATHFVINKGQHFQVQFETVIPAENSSLWGELTYRIYFWHSDKSIMDEIKGRTQQRRYKYPPFMGISEYTAELEFVEEITEDRIQEIRSDDYEDFATVLNADLIAEYGLEFKNGNQPLQYMKEIMPLEFKSDRSNKSMGRFIFEKNLQNIRAKIKSPFIRIDDVNLAFMEVDNATN